ncbi:hypothetical protein PPERSA_12774 [Pseudocohnilembus persalinus]|uniref:Uncharacterized protein n=1 Tax=Pseudocohnilembus persalinus TaxID=266149 RepID=A0A0V0QTC9_PSEPJ|nr:hypothetical protein PPERSA_12774 [Pseudocohnilembus persalinus]|eukprot:KRX05596.1 hypothetical protein PPERSA_12774 [Pseudocohnilembus persalinus]
MQGGIQNANSSQYSFQGVRPPPSSYKGGPSRAGVGLQSKAGRPTTSMNSAGFGKKESKDQFRETRNKFKEGQVDQGPEEQFKKMEAEINKLVEDSAVAKLKGDLQAGLEKAKDAYNKERTMRREREKQNMIDSINFDLQYYVAFNLANQLQQSGVYSEAIDKYNEILKNKEFKQAGRLRVNIGNIYFQKGNYSIAIKMYRMAYDLVPAASKEMRFKILKNIGHAFVKMGNFQQAINSYENIIKWSPDFQTAFNLMVCLFALGDVVRMKDCFVSMLQIEIPGFTEEEEEEMQKDQLYNDSLREDIKEKKRVAIKFIVDAAKLISPIIEGGDVVAGYEWILETLKTSYFPEVESEVEIQKAMAFLKKKNMEKAIESLKSLEKKDKQIMGRVSTNISFLYFLEQDFKEAEKYAEMAISYDRYNAKALVNRGNCLFIRNEFLRSKEQYLEAIGVEADCVEALYNLAFVNKKLNMFMEALQALEKLQTIISTPEVIYQMASIHELMGNTKQALKWYQVLLTRTPSDPQILLRVGGIFAREEDESQALHYYGESYKFLNTNIETISWLGIYYVKQELYERACQFFERASQIQPKEMKWRLMVASCYRRMGSYQKALKIYEEIYQQDPDNIECLKFLTQLYKDMNMPYEEVAAQLRKKELEISNQPMDYPDQNLQYMNDQNQQQQNNIYNDYGNNQQDDQPFQIRQTQSRANQQTKVAKQNKNDDGNMFSDDDDIPL